ncbi:hypothetical protein AVEN_218890-1 [Araneus ventricosus]|uniref:Uncharacterized protein n=1 Tax=Araneus ventricosus TaxID=182803 RepID=A0A4Y2UC46_ARAVE|nr:hypothetical protein AVEN_218890-1 [Araneus ventricosus]
MHTMGTEKHAITHHVPRKNRQTAGTHASICGASGITHQYASGEYRQHYAASLLPHHGIKHHASRIGITGIEGIASRITGCASHQGITVHRWLASGQTNNTASRKQMASQASRYRITISRNRILRQDQCYHGITSLASRITSQHHSIIAHHGGVFIGRHRQK